MSVWMMPSLVLLIAALFAGPLGPRWRYAALLAAPIVSFALVLLVPEGVALRGEFLGYGIEPVEGSLLRRLFALLFVCVLFGATLFAWPRAAWYEVAAGHAYAAGAVGVCFAGDIITLFLWWELMALCSIVLVWCGGGLAARDAGIRYGLLHILGGVILKVGIEGVMVHTGDVNIRVLTAADFDTWMLLLGVLFNAAAFPLVAWLPDANVHASATGSVYLSAFTTKTAVLVLWLLFPGETVLLGVGLVTAFWAGLYAFLERDARKSLAYLLVSQVGLLVAAIGVDTTGTRAALLWMTGVHTLGFALLFACLAQHSAVSRDRWLRRAAGVLGLLMVGVSPALSGVIGLLGSVLPAGSGLAIAVALALVAAGLAERLWRVLIIEAGGDGEGWHRRCTAIVWLALMGVGALLVLPLVEPDARLTVDRYSVAFLVVFAALLILTWRRFLKRGPPGFHTTDIDWLWRVATPALYRFSCRRIERLWCYVAAVTGRGVAGLDLWLSRHVGTRGALGRSWEIGTTAFWVVSVLSIYALSYFLLR